MGLGWPLGHTGHLAISSSSFQISPWEKCTTANATFEVFTENSTVTFDVCKVKKDN